MANTAKQTVTAASVTLYEGVKKIFEVFYCYLSSVYAKLTLNILKVMHNIGLCTTLSFVFPTDVFCLIMTLLSSSVLFNCFWHVAQFQNAQWHVDQLNIFLIFMSDLKKVIE